MLIIWKINPSVCRILNNIQTDTYTRQYWNEQTSRELPRVKWAWPRSHLTSTAAAGRSVQWHLQPKSSYCCCCCSAWEETQTQEILHSGEQLTSTSTSSICWVFWGRLQFIYKHSKWKRLLQFLLLLHVTPRVDRCDRSLHCCWSVFC